ncbi:MAG: T9SS type A sorting domain-containing protein [Bacteroidales bacterium]|nr:T9SS type A sorting domain-containing protein [Bacteroidales bacterium]
MKTIYLLSVLWFFATNLPAQTVADSLVRDSVPILLTDTTSYNTHPRMMIYSGNQSTYEDSTTAYLLFYDKTPDTASYASIWYRDLKNMGPETVFLQSNDSVRYCNPQATNAGVIFYEEWHDTLVSIKGLLIDPLTVSGLDTVTVTTLPPPLKMVANAGSVLWIADSVLYRLPFTVNSGTLVPCSLDTVSANAVDVCVADNVADPWYPSGSYAFAYSKHENNTDYLYENNLYASLIDSGMISGIHYNYNSTYFYYKKNDTVRCHTAAGYFFSPSYPIALMGNDTMALELATSDEGIALSKVSGYFIRTAFVPGTLYNVFNYSTFNGYYLAADTFVFPDPYQQDGIYSYPFPPIDTIKNIIMQRGFIFYTTNYTTTWDLKIILEVGHDSICSLYLVNSSVSDIVGSNNRNVDNSGVQIYPNPAGNELWVEYLFVPGNAPETIDIFTLDGKRIFSQKINTAYGILQLDVSGIQAGNYIVKTGKYSKQITIVK